jgi:hypothetical protein
LEHSNSTFLSRAWIEEVDSYFDEEDKPEARLDIPPLQLSQHGDPAAAELVTASSLSERAFTANSDGFLETGDTSSNNRPRTPMESQFMGSSEETTPENTLSRDITNETRLGTEGFWTPRSLRAQSALSMSSAQSPPARDTPGASQHEPPFGSSPAAESPGSQSQPPNTNLQSPGYAVPNSESQDPTLWNLHLQQHDRRSSTPATNHDVPVSTRSRWSSENPSATDTTTTTTSTTTGSLFQRMRNIFEPHPQQQSIAAVQNQANRNSRDGTSWFHFDRTPSSGSTGSRTEIRYSAPPMPRRASSAVTTTSGGTTRTVDNITTGNGSTGQADGSGDHVHADVHTRGSGDLSGNGNGN